MRTFGYMRVSTVDQNEDRQSLELAAWGIPPRDIYMDKLSGKDFNRPQYRRMKKRLKKNDLLVVKSIDRLGRNYHDIQEEWRIITKVIGADIVILDMPLLDTRKDKDLIGTLIADIVLQLLSYVAETERVNIRQRQKEGIAAARLKGVHLGRYPDPIPDAFFPIYEKWEQRIITGKEAAEQLGLSPNQFDTPISTHLANFSCVSPLQFDILSETLRNARKNPEAYRSLVVRAAAYLSRRIDRVVNSGVTHIVFLEF